MRNLSTKSGPHDFRHLPPIEALKQFGSLTLLVVFPFWSLVAVGRNVIQVAWVIFGEFGAGIDPAGLSNHVDKVSTFGLARPTVCCAVDFPDLHNSSNCLLNLFSPAVDFFIK